MNTIVIEILRNGQAVNQLLQPQFNYIALCGSEPANDFKIECTQQDFDDHVKLLRYDNTDQVSRHLGIDFFQKLITDIINQIFPTQLASHLKKDFLHLRLVTTPKEIAQLPFEMALTPVQLQNELPQIPFFVNPLVKTTFTREVRQMSFKHYAWPFKPRILFAWAQPGNAVPWQEQFDAFVSVLRPWAIPLKTRGEPVPDIGALITLLQNASLGAVQKEITTALNAGKPYTHVHILAHGSKNEIDPNGEQFLLVLNSDNKEEKVFRANGKELADALVIEKDGEKFAPQVVSLIACDSGNMGSPVHPAGSLAHYLHQSGIPCVFASQFPLTQAGSVKLVTALYTQLLESSDPRLALYDTRAALNVNQVHDWASLVAYARFPEDIDEQMKGIHLKILLQFMKVSNAFADHIIQNINNIKPEKIDAFFTEVNERLNNSISNLTGLIEQSKNDKADKDRFAEHYGLIGSAYKRKAEHLFRVAAFKNNISLADCSESINALKCAEEWYYNGYQQYLNSHWNGTQYLSLAVFLNKSAPGEKESEMWIFCKVMASKDKENAPDDEGRAWACGTLAELYLLKPFIKAANAGQDENKAAFDEAKKCLQQLNALPGQQFPKESTARQLERYINWLPRMINSPVALQLKLLAIELRKELPEFEII